MKGCLTYLTYVYDTTTGIYLLEPIMVNYEFSYIFHIDLPSLPLKHDINLGINVELGTQSNSPYCMNPIELRELMK